MTDHLASEQLSAFVDEETTPPEREAIAAHLSACEECRQKHEELLAVERALAPLRKAEAAPDLLGDLRRRIARPPTGRGSWAWALAGAMVVAVLLLAWQKPWGTTPAPVVNPGTPSSVPHAVRVREPGPLLPVRLAETAPARTSPRHPRRWVRRPAPTPLQVSVEKQERPAPQLLAAGPSQVSGVILVLGEPQRIPPSSKCYLKVQQPDGATSQFSQVQTRDAEGHLQSAEISYRTTVATLP